jgi:hypothetical protein
MKTFITVLLLAFIVASIGYMAVKKSHGQTPTNDPASPGKTITQQADSKTIAAQPAAVAQPVAGNNRVVVYYLHGNKRCTNCILFEEYTTEAINNGLADKLQDGTLELKILNTDEPENAHFVTDFQLTTKAVVVVKYKDGVQTNWKNLDKIWNLVKNKDEFIKYIQTETKTYLEGA